MMKKTLAFLCAAAFAACLLAGCAKKDAEAPTADSVPAAESTLSTDAESAAVPGADVGNVVASDAETSARDTSSLDTPTTEAAAAQTTFAVPETPVNAEPADENLPAALEETADASLVGIWENDEVRYLFREDSTGSIAEKGSDVRTPFDYEAQQDKQLLTIYIGSLDNGETATYSFPDAHTLVLSYADGTVYTLTAVD